MLKLDCLNATGARKVYHGMGVSAHESLKREIPYIFEGYFYACVFRLTRLTLCCYLYACVCDRKFYLGHAGAVMV